MGSKSGVKVEMKVEVKVDGGFEKSYWERIMRENRQLRLIWIMLDERCHFGYTDLEEGCKSGFTRGGENGKVVSSMSCRNWWVENVRF